MPNVGNTVNMTTVSRLITLRNKFLLATVTTLKPVNGCIKKLVAADID